MDINNKRLAFGGVWLAVVLSLNLARLSLEMDLNKDSSLLQVANRRNRRSNGDNIEITGNITFDQPPQTIPSNSQLRVEFHDARIADASSIKLGETLVNLANYKNETPLIYKMTATRPKEHGHYSVPAVLNMGWTRAAGSDEWLKSGDYHTSMVHHLFVNITSGKNKFTRNVKMELYIHSVASIDLGNKVLFTASHLVILVMYLQW